MSFLLVGRVQGQVLRPIASPNFGNRRKPNPIKANFHSQNWGRFERVPMGSVSLSCLYVTRKITLSAELPEELYFSPSHP
jgi:hypothetical protein